MNLEAALRDPFILRLRSALMAHTPLQHAASDGVRQAAVALIIRVPDSGEPELLMIKRAEYENDPWSGHIALPGGRMEGSDASLERTAVRETAEELALDMDSVCRVIGALDDVAPRSPRLPAIVIRPFVAVAGDVPALVLSSEVAMAFWVPLARLRDPASYIRSVVSARGEELQVNGYALGEHFVWGLTERILRRFFELV